MPEARSAHRLGGREAGQAAVEAALTLPLTLFLVLGTLQLFMMLQARIMTQYAAFRAVRVGSVNYGDCSRMTDAAIGALLPTLARTDSPGALAAAFRAYKGNQYQQGRDATRDGPVVWMFREQPTLATVAALTVSQGQDLDFDDPNRSSTVDLEVRLIYWYALRIPFADWVISRMALAHFGLMNYTSANPLLLTQRQGRTNWQDSTTSWSMGSSISAEFLNRVSQRQYVFPIQATYSMRMMTPVKQRFFTSQDCPPAP